MYCICIDKETGELFIMERSERETMINVLLDLKQPIPSWVLNLKNTKNEAEKYVSDILESNRLINETFPQQK